MQFPESWLRTFVDPQLTTDELSHALTMAGLEVESLSKAAPPTSKIVVGRVLEVVKHPDADKLNVCQVDAGTGATLNIVCGAPNVAPGIKVPVALVGAELPPAEEGGKPFAIKLSKLRGVESQGMLCSARELKLSEDHSGLLILPEDTPVGQDIRDTLNLDDTIFEIKLTPNKADCLSVFGIARETAAITGAPLTPVDIRPVRVELDETLPVRIAAPDLCGRFSGRVIRGVNAHAKTPQWMVERLERSGQRSVSALVDISNYVMFELGRPSHVFDLDKIHGGIEVRWGKRGESLKLLNGNTVELDETVGVIADDRHVESLAGIMGGDSTAVTLDTTNIYLEAAFWWPDSIRGRARKYNFSTDAAHRFERGVDYATTVEHVERITQLILEICGGKAGPIDDQAVNLPQRAPVKMRVSRANRIIGVKIDADEIADIFTRLGLPFVRDDDAFLVTPPSHRFDIEIEEDLIEEVARIYGFEKIPARPPVATSEMRATNETQRSIHDIRHALAARDYAETVNFSFVDAEWEHDFAGNDTPIRLLNPIASQLSVMRTTLFGSLISVLRHNLNRRADRVRVFEAGRVFLADSSVKAGELTVEGYTQPKRVGALAYGPAVDEQWGVATRAVDFFDVKGDLEALLAPAAARFVKAEHPALHPGRSARIEVDGRAVGWIGELHPRLMQKYELPHAPVMFEIDTDALIARALPAPTDVSKFPPVRRDIAVVVDQAVEVQALFDEMKKALAEDACRFVQKVVLFDEFRAKSNTSGGLAAHEKSLAFRVTLQDPAGTLQDEVVDQAIQTLVERMARAGARLRG
ncbi:phenylalanine--tRNA ligase, beta subunit [Burkholderia ambifaria AMMD]|uniref:Phenylalanine--tRNA ligase beta subunit n=1 Tax=Burkholderia ambifaria (strain ATCC BAA-244 / DSM 16087 / CCUG 44356 / LMG 19182 / AMMD) TaxID=339670 RepID=Q0BG01_BURCM|nr:phenylalanine--tRNA ligase subunit beta [Burkholderia ambifaria]ABI86922.1 phenylalanyl-tRNA synthetase beta subunit [Burkholderia ambifaria AMMD]AJY20498.1 phenylalanine--tRNA ligase, beta subunit [Burkholderia ambifaria AMMD]MBR7929457.1 phenylalanine--tRNA ligase subunit beta [Burkholderia ambifaria]PEH65830.1 phenylalanine--tRNA ligase subunit beta [Burkholderia ambifaria]QQC05838.1 phenylalanine--tRNA ligase subunit beta [Burkholderia ambifaria]